MPQFLIEGDAVRRQAGNLDVTVGGLRRVLDAYHSSVQSTFGTWLGLGAGAFRTFDGRFQQAAGDLVNALDVLRTEVDAAGLDYDNNETSQQQAVTALNGLLPGGRADNLQAPTAPAATPGDTASGFVQDPIGEAGSGLGLDDPSGPTEPESSLDETIEAQEEALEESIERQTETTERDIQGEPGSDPGGRRTG